MSTETEHAAEDYAAANFDLTGKTALVTGASRGIGKAIALALAARGADVVVNCNTGGALAESVRDEIRRIGRKSEYYAHNVGDEDEVQKMHDEILSEFSQVDILINNAGITRDKSFKKMTREMWDAVINVDLTGVFLVTKQFIEPMAERRWGRVISIASVIGEIGNFGQANYAAAKGGLIAFSKSLAREYARKGVTVNTVAPGFIKTDMTDAVPPEGLKMVCNATPVGRLGLPREVAAGVAFLAMDAASYITGHVLDINGGYAM
ncbi:MAG: 3-oxoacyl-[acyl-carrier-protein] reductase [Planctomycetaceae bacterium]|mgnify:CR=1 FL=1|nr:3-oxoacyl-[acyl-carrier-protein] reductase [Planctomycetaceae bacterium]